MITTPSSTSSGSNNLFAKCFSVCQSFAATLERNIKEVILLKEKYTSGKHKM